MNLHIEKNTIIYWAVVFFVQKVDAYNFCCIWAHELNMKVLRNLKKILVHFSFDRKIWYMFHCFYDEVALRGDDGWRLKHKFVTLETQKEKEILAMVEKEE